MHSTFFTLAYCVLLYGLVSCTSKEPPPPTPQPPPVSNTVKVEPVIQKPRQKRTRIVRPPVASEPVFDLPAPEGMTLAFDKGYDKTFTTSYSMDQLESFLRKHFPNHTITRFRSGNLQASPPKGDGIRVMVTQRSNTKRVVSYHRVFSKATVNREAAMLKALDAKPVEAPDPDTATASPTMSEEVLNIERGAAPKAIPLPAGARRPNAASPPSTPKPPATP